MRSGSPTRPRGQRVAHLVVRFFGSLRAGRIDDATRAWVGAALQAGEQRAWEGMHPVDQAEGVAVARRLELALAGTTEGSDPRWRAAALVHDAGKQLSGFGTLSRAAVTVIIAVVGDTGSRRWADARGPLRARIGRYAAHDDLGEARLRDLGARAEVAAWAGVHHRPHLWAGTGIPGSVCRALAAADGEPVPPAGPD